MVVLILVLRTVLAALLLCLISIVVHKKHDRLGGWQPKFGTGARLPLSYEYCTGYEYSTVAALDEDSSCAVFLYSSTSDVLYSYSYP